MSPVAGLTDPTSPPVRPVSPAAGESIIAFEERDSCPVCEAPLATDQRYCLTCGHRRGDPRLPFLDAATSADFAAARAGTGRTSPPPPSRQGSRGRSPNASLIAVVAVLILAVGLGFLIGRAGHEGGSAANQGTERITIEGGGEAPAPEALSDPQAESAPKPDGRSGHESAGPPGGATESKQPPGPESLPEVQEDKAQRETQEQLHAVVPLAKPTAKVGESCTRGTPGCGKNKKFNGVFFGAEE
jgi:hypothetical protein